MYYGSRHIKARAFIIQDFSGLPWYSPNLKKHLKKKKKRKLSFIRRQLHWVSVAACTVEWQSGSVPTGLTAHKAPSAYYLASYEGMCEGKGFCLLVHRDDDIVDYCVTSKHMGSWFYLNLSFHGFERRSLLISHLGNLEQVQSRATVCVKQQHPVMHSWHCW